MTEVVAALIGENEKFLICRRPPNKARADLWELVGGKVEPYETKQQALRRECREELAITVVVGEEIADVTYQYPDITIHLTLFRCALAEGVPQLLEHTELKWITPEEMPQYAFCPADTQLLQKLGERA